MWIGSAYREVKSGNCDNSQRLYIRSRLDQVRRCRPSHVYTDTSFNMTKDVRGFEGGPALLSLGHDTNDLTSGPAQRKQDLTAPIFFYDCIWDFARGVGFSFL